jgi:hypothetical protein
MHLQIRTIPASSPPDVEKILAVLAKAGVNLVGIGGSNVEFGGELALVPQHGQEDEAEKALTQAGYVWRELQVDRDPELVLCEVENKSGALHDCLEKVASDNLAAGRIIRDILIGIPDEEDVKNGTTPVHIYSEQVRSVNALGRG